MNTQTTQKNRSNAVYHSKVERNLSSNNIPMPSYAFYGEKAGIIEETPTQPSGEEVGKKLLKENI